MVEPEQPAHFLLLHSETGGGHRRAALSVADALRFRYGERARVAVVDALADYAPWPFRRLPEWYGDMLWGGGWSYGLGYQLLNGRRRARGAARLSWPRVRTAARRLLMDCPADVVVSFHPLLVQPLCRALAATVSPAPLVAVGADLVAMHAFWVDPGVRRYLVATDAARAELLRHGADPARVEVTGLPVRRRFAEAARADPPSARARVGLDPRRPAVLVMGGGDGLGPLEGMVRAIAAADPPAQVVVIVGRNEPLRARLVGLEWPGPVRVEGFVENVHDWMAAADLLVTKAGPNTVAEALVMGLPMVLWEAIPAQETPNVRLVVQGGAGVWAPGVARATRAVRRLLADPARAARMRGNARLLSRPRGAERVADALWRVARPR